MANFHAILNLQFDILIKKNEETSKKRISIQCVLIVIKLFSLLRSLSVSFASYDVAISSIEHKIIEIIDN